MQITNRLSEVFVSYSPRVKPSQLPQISTSKEANECFREIWSNQMSYREEAYMLLLNRCNKVLGYSLLSVGGTTGTIVDVKVIFQTALKSNAHALILAHNHPSGNNKPSETDLRITKEVKEAGKLLGIQLLDHLILTEEGFYSFADEGNF
jgi:DNA repair protein RadC